MIRLETKKAVDVIDGFVKLREPDLNRRPRGYEPRELPSCSIPRVKRYRLWISCLALGKKNAGKAGGDRREAFGLWAIAPGRLRGDARVTEPLARHR